MEKLIKLIEFSPFQLIELAKELLEKNELEKIVVTNKYAINDKTLVCELDGSAELLLYDINPSVKRYPNYSYYLDGNKVYFHGVLAYPKDAVTNFQLNGTFGQLFDYIDEINHLLEFVIKQNTTK
ncbi:hypothetical protein [Fusobacterium polymorphum]|uniref:hypothetical protein n=1 Tax=Fusobacterium nucleatum subsp. polymorphum TaxID=76857 RepID=UPI00300B04B7